MSPSHGRQPTLFQTLLPDHVVAAFLVRSNCVRGWCSNRTSTSVTGPKPAVLHAAAALAQVGPAAPETAAVRSASVSAAGLASSYVCLLGLVLVHSVLSVFVVLARRAPAHTSAHGCSRARRCAANTAEHTAHPPVEQGTCSTCRFGGHGSGGATTLRHYADPVSEVDRRAAAYLAQLTAGSVGRSK